MDTADQPTDSASAEAFVAGLHFGEGPRWHEGRLWFADQYDHGAFSVGPDGDVRREVAVDPPEQLSGLGWLPDGRLLAVAMQSRTVLRREPDGTLVLHGDLMPWATWHANDMVVSAEGRAYVGNFGFDLEPLFEGTGGEPRNTSIVRVDPDGAAAEAADDLAFPNGTVIFPGGSPLVVAESMGGRLTAFDVASDGSLTNRRLWAQFEGVFPDGICLDADGHIWAANAGGPSCVLVAEGGRVLRRVETSQPCFACMLGDEDRRTLYCMTAPTSQASVLAATTDAKIERLRVDVPGAGLP